MAPAFAIQFWPSRSSLSPLEISTPASRTLGVAPVAGSVVRRNGLLLTKSDSSSGNNIGFGSRDKRGPSSDVGAVGDTGGNSNNRLLTAWIQFEGQPESGSIKGLHPIVANEGTTAQNTLALLSFLLVSYRCPITNNSWTDRTHRHSSRRNECKIPKCVDIAASSE